MQLNRAPHGWDSFQSCASLKQPGFHILPLRWLLTNDYLITLQKKKKLSKLKLSLISDNRASGGDAVFSFIYRLYASIVTATRLEGSVESLSCGLHLK